MRYYNYLSGGMTPDHFLAALTIAAVGWGCYKAVSFLMRNRSSQNTPPKASITFWIRDNYQEALAHSVLLFALIRFASEIIARTVPNSAEWLESNDPMWIYFVVGVAKSFIIEKARKSMKEAKKAKS